MRLLKDMLNLNQIRDLFKDKKLIFAFLSLIFLLLQVSIARLQKLRELEH